MSELTLSGTINSEQKRLTNRCAVIDTIVGALEDERRAHMERLEALRTMLEMYEKTENVITSAHRIQASNDISESQQKEEAEDDDESQSTDNTVRFVSS